MKEREWEKGTEEIRTIMRKTREGGKRRGERKKTIEGEGGGGGRGGRERERWLHNLIVLCGLSWFWLSVDVKFVGGGSEGGSKQAPGGSNMDGLGWVGLIGWGWGGGVSIAGVHGAVM